MSAGTIPGRISRRIPPRTRWLLPLTFVTAVLAPALAGAQAAPAPPPREPTWDTTAVVGLLSGHPPSPENRRYADEWFNSAQAGVQIGRHLTTHLKVEAEATTSSEGRRFVERYIRLPGVSYDVPYGSEQFSRVHEASIGVTYQFFENEWIHPFVHAGAALDINRERTHTWAQSFYSGDPRQPGSQVVFPEEARAETTTASASGIAGGGAKFYFTERAFVRADGRFAIGARRQHLALRLGIGVDWGR
jgi:hypothetical protein